MILFEDSRQQVGRHKNIELYCKRHGIEIVRQKLEVGDYMLDPVDGKISVDTKENMLEISKNLMSNDHRRIRAECERAMAMGIQLIFLIEETVPYGEVDMWEVPIWKTSGRYHRYGEPMTLVNPKALKKAMQTMEAKYGVKFRFCNRRETPRRLIKYLKGEYR